MRACGARVVLLGRRKTDRVVAAQPTLEDGVGWTCPTCNLKVTTSFCAACGEQKLSPRDLTLAGLGEKLLHAFTSIDARAARSVMVLLRTPGALTVAWTSGIRKPYVAPFQLFLIANVIFFALQSLTGDAVLSSSLQSHLQHQDWSELAQSLLAQHLAATHIASEQYAPVFDRAVVLNAQSLVVLMAMAFALLPPLVFVRERRPFMTHVVFSLHLYTFLLVLFCAALLLAAFSAQLGVGGLETPRVDNLLSVANFAGCTAYLYLAIGPVYGAVGARRVVQTALLAVSVPVIVLGYRFVIFLITLYTA